MMKPMKQHNLPFAQRKKYGVQELCNLAPTKKSNHNVHRIDAIPLSRAAKGSVAKFSNL